MIDFVKDIYDGMKTFMVGMKVTGGYLKENFKQKEESVITVEYDGTVEKARQVKVADRFRGHLDNDIERCIVCKNCAKACPIDCFWIDGEKTPTNKLRPSRFDIDILKCMYCGLCVFAARRHARHPGRTRQPAWPDPRVRRRLLRRRRKGRCRGQAPAHRRREEEGRRRGCRKEGRRSQGQGCRGCRQEGRESARAARRACGRCGAGRSEGRAPVGAPDPRLRVL
ncbi:MAG: 4Fe-4S dicluster domain-containing protein [Planctomycetes bacterium]|nr:4Fe-4S dicluster domain-containing protein [Planctomycetota bacterium]